MILDLLFVALVGAAVVRGFARGFTREFLDLLSLLIGIPVCFRIGGPLGERLFSDWAPVAARTLGAVVILAILGLAAAGIGRVLLGSRAELDDAEHLGGLVMGAVRGAVFAGLALLIAAAAAAGTPIGRAASDSLIVGAIASPDGTGLRLFETATGEHTITDLIEFNQRFPEGAVLADGYRSLPPADPADLSADPDAAFEIFAMVNDARQAQGLHRLAWWDAMADVGAAYAEEMYLNGFFSHDSPRTGNVATRLTAAGIGYAIAGENLALAPNPGAVHTGLMNSPGHRANILHREFTRVGIGVIRGPLGMMVVQIFQS